MDKREEFTQWLISKGYREYTPSGSRSTARDYPFRVLQVCQAEGLSWESLSARIDAVVSEYDKGGSKEMQGKRSHSSVINALKRYREFSQELEGLS